jgi:autotransporter-associated beta strand protein
MKRIIFALAIVAMICSDASAQSTRYWDINGTTGGAGGASPSGTWSSAITNWNATADGTGAATTWSNNGNARFSAGTDATAGFTVTVSGTINVNQIGVEQGDPTFTGGILNFSHAANSTSLLTGIAAGEADVTITMDSQVAGTNGFRMARSTIAGNQILNLNNTANSFTGGLQVNSGQLIRLGASGVIPDANVVSFDTTATAATLDVNGKSETVTALAHAGGTALPSITLGTGTLTLSGPTGQIFIGVISGAGGSVVKNGAGTQIFTGNNTYTGGTTIGAGILQIGNGGTTGSLASGSGASITNNGTLRFIRTDGTQTIAGAITGTGAVDKLAANTILLTNSGNTYSGGTTISGGTIAVGHNNALGTGTVTLNAGAINADGAARTIANNVVLAANSSVSGSNNLTVNGSFTNSGGNRTLTVSNTGLTTLAGSVFLSEVAGTGRTLTIGGTGSLVISGDVANFNGAGTMGNLTIADPGTGNLHTVTLSGNNTYSGNTTLNIRSGLHINSTTALGTGTFVVNSTTSVTFDNTSGSAITLVNSNNINLSGGSPTFVGTNDLSFGNNIVAMINANRTITTSAGTLTIGAITQDIAGRNFNKGGAGTLVLLGSSSYTGSTNINGGTIRLATSGAISDSSTVNLADVAGANLDLNGNNETVANISGGGALGGNIQLGGGTLTAGNAANTTYAGVISGTGAVVKQGAGTLTLTGASTYGGGTTINAGTLQANNAPGTSATGGGGVTVNSGGTLAGTGAVTGAVTVDGGTLAPGTSIESLDIGASLTFNNLSTFDVELNTTAVDADLVNANGALNIVGDVMLSLTDLNSVLLLTGRTKFTLISYAGTWNGGIFLNHEDDTLVSVGVNTYTINYNDTAGGSNFGGGMHGKYLTLTAVPEASAFVFGGLACVVAGLIQVRRMLKRRQTAC